MPQASRREENSGSVIYLNYRNIGGEIVGRATSMVNTDGPIVPSLGVPLDYYVDCHGYSTSYILLLYDLMSIGTSYPDFISHLNSHGISRREAEYVYSLLPDTLEDSPKRKRTVVVPF